LFLFLSSNTIPANAKRVQAEQSIKILNVTWGIYKTVQVTFDSAHEILVFQKKIGNFQWTLQIQVDSETYWDTGTWTETEDQITITEPNTDLTLVITKGQKTSGFHVWDPPGGGSTWILFSKWSVDSASGSLGGSNLGSMTSGVILTALEAWS